MSLKRNMIRAQSISCQTTTTILHVIVKYLTTGFCYGSNTINNFRWRERIFLGYIKKVPVTKATFMYTSEYTTDIERMGMSQMRMTEPRSKKPLEWALAIWTSKLCLPRYSPSSLFPSPKKFLCMFSCVYACCLCQFFWFNHLNHNKEEKLS